jgi:hypothetical protein
MNMVCELRSGIKGDSEHQASRADFVNKVYCEACNENGLKICSPDDFTAWKDYLDGKIGEAELEVRVKDELSSLSKMFQKYTVIDGKASLEKEKENRAHRAKQANTIYKSACSEHHLEECFFGDFLNWSRYVEGSISESEFAEIVRAEAIKLSEAE